MHIHGGGSNEFEVVIKKNGIVKINDDGAGSVPAIILESNGILVGAKQDADISGGSSTKDINIKDDTKFYRAGLIIGAGAEFEVSGNTSITAGLTFNNGFTDITSSKSSTVKNHYVAINFGVFF